MKSSISAEFCGIAFFFLGSDSPSQAEVVSAMPPYIVPQSELKSQATQASIVQQPQQQSQVPVETLPESFRQNAPVADTPSVYQQVVDDIHAKKLRNCSFRSLMSTYDVNQTQAAAIRLKLVTEGKAKFNRRHELDLL
jgi:hypothetical protein